VIAAPAPISAEEIELRDLDIAGWDWLDRLDRTVIGKAAVATQCGAETGIWNSSRSTLRNPKIAEAPCFMSGDPRGQKTNIPITAPNMARAVKPTANRANGGLGCSRMIFRSEATIRMPTRRKGAMSPLTTADQ
jgi:hypothetical protein